LETRTGSKGEYVRTLLPALLLLAACGSGFEAGPFVEDAAPASDAPRDTAPARDAGTETSPIDASPVDAAPVDAARLPDATHETTTTCNPYTLEPAFTCTGTKIVVSSSGSFCSFDERTSVATVLNTPPECLCDYSCQCLMTSAADLCGPGLTFLGCTNDEGLSPEVTCQ
jgi:hypothetical protein